MKKNSLSGMQLLAIAVIPITAFLAFNGYINSKSDPIQASITERDAKLTTAAERDSSHSSGDSSDKPELVNDPSSLDSYPFVNYSDVTSEYAGQIICVDCIRGKSNYGSAARCGIWFPTNESYVYYSISGISNSDVNSPDYVFISASEGDIIRYATHVRNDGSFIISDVLSAEVIGHKDINEVYATVKENCPYLNPDTFCRDPDKYTYVPVRTNGTILQIINEDSDYATYLLSTSTGCVYLDWREDSVIRGGRLLEDDSVWVYGTFAGLETYNSLIGQKTVPKVDVDFIELN